MTAAGQELKVVLDEQVRCAEELLEALAREQQALVGNSADALTTATASKAALVATLENLEARRRRLTNTGPRDAHEPAESSRLMHLVAECKRRNDKNGVLLTARAANVRSALKVLRGDEPALYGRKGGATPARHGARPLGTA